MLSEKRGFYSLVSLRATQREGLVAMSQICDAILPIFPLHQLWQPYHYQNGLYGCKQQQSWDKSKITLVDCHNVLVSLKLPQSTSLQGDEICKWWRLDGSRYTWDRGRSNLTGFGRHKVGDNQAVQRCMLTASLLVLFSTTSRIENCYARSLVFTTTRTFRLTEIRTSAALCL